ncbi:hypothetical protein N7532_006495 [Penicillium argentinense]|uniref:Uncharacterized protein n=1 Tax=Penicillium argentinense TaxID=1131581 RepID=A0A9W9KAT1_9EURO|nr:uncharacterized protein N7532_006495 [Penicillium argentinense]KAJ5099494.1 hypothetical protein N7532_006495 [Penicillium argentinense]
MQSPADPAGEAAIPATSSTNVNKNTNTWTQSFIASIRDLFTREPASKEPESDALSGWVGMRKGKGRCRSVGEVH